MGDLAALGLADTLVGGAVISLLLVGIYALVQVQKTTSDALSSSSDREHRAHASRDDLNDEVTRLYARVLRLQWAVAEWRKRALASGYDGPDDVGYPDDTGEFRLPDTGG